MNRIRLTTIERVGSDRYVSRPAELQSLVGFCRANQLSHGWVTSKTTRATLEHEGVTLHFVPTAELCYTVGHNVIHRKRQLGQDLV